MTTIAFLTPDDREALEALLQELHQYYFDAPQPPSETSATASKLIAGRYTETIMAWENRRPLGLAIFTFLHPTRSPGGVLLMKDLFVSSQARSRGVGRLLMARLAQIAKEQECSRIDWTARRGSLDTIRFYETIGASEVDEKVYFRIRSDAFDSVIENTAGKKGR